MNHTHGIPAVNILDIFRNYDMINKIKYKKL